MRKFSKRLLTFVLACAMVFGLSGMTALATEADEQDAQLAAAEPDAISEAEGVAEDAATDETVAGDETVTLDAAGEYEPDYDWYTEGTSPYVISTAEELAGLSDIVNGTAPTNVGHDTFKGKTVKLEAVSGYIDMNEDAPVSWTSEDKNGVVDIQVKATEDTCVFTPIGNMRFNSDGSAVKDTYAFEGTFEGNGVTIENLYVTGDEGYLGLFGAVGGTDAAGEDGYGTVRNFKLSGVVECTGGSSNSQVDYVGGAVGKLNAGGTVEYVTTNENFLVDAPGTDNVGGIVGFAGTPTGLGYDSNPSVSNTHVLCCGNNATVLAYYKVGGIVGENAATVKYCCNKDKGWILCRRSSGQGAGVGGIVGRNGNNNIADEEALVAYCYNTGKITNNGRNDNSASNTIRGYAGICGTTYGANGKVETHNCYNIGAIPKGYGQYNSITNYIEEGAAVAVRDNYSPKDSGVIINAGNSEQEIGNTDYTDAEFKNAARYSGTFLYDLGAYFVADTTKKINNGYPILFWEDNQGEPKITNLRITQQPDKTTYNNEVFDPTGMVVTATYSNGASMEIPSAYATYEGTTYTLSDGYTYDYGKKLSSNDKSVAITFDGITRTVLINRTEEKNYISVSTSAGNEYQLSCSDIDKALDDSTITAITDADAIVHNEKFVLVKDLLQTCLGITDCDKITVYDAESNDVTVPGDKNYQNINNLYLYNDGTSYCIAGNQVPYTRWYNNVSIIKVTLHDWSDVVWTWSQDFTSATASRTCSICNKKEEATVDITTDVIEPGYRTAGKTTYTATATFPDGTVATDTRDTDFEAAEGYIDIVINRGENKTETGQLWYSDINEAMDNTTPQTFTYTTGTGMDPTSVTNRFVPIAALLNITDTIDDACCYYVKSDVDGDYEIYLPTSACMYFRDDTLIYRTAVDGSAGRMWVNSPTSIEVRYQHDWGDLEWEWSSDYDFATVTGRCQMDVCEHGEKVKTTKITSGKKGEYDTLTATAEFSDGTVVTDTIYLVTY